MSEIIIKKHSLTDVNVITERDWDGYILVMSRDTFLRHKRNNKLDIVGVYVIYSDHFHKEKYGNSIYIGQGDDVRARLESHAKSKPFWNKVLIFTSPRLNIAFTFNIEKDFIKCARFANRYKIENGDLGQTKKLSSDDTDYYLDFVSISRRVLSMANIDVFDFNSDGLFFSTQLRIEAKIRVEDSGSITLCKGSTFHNFRDTQNKAEELGIVNKIDFFKNNLVITEDIELTIESKDITLFTGNVISSFKNSCGVSLYDLLREKG
ncbi:hypothetical protein [Aliivibrio fischeri]|nr:hypothetical protein [Aliivibrio fischeri]